MNLRVLERGKHNSSHGDNLHTITEWKSILTEKGLLTETSRPDVYEINDPNGGTQVLNLTPWSGRDPDKTFISIQFQWRDPAKVGTFYRR